MGDVSGPDEDGALRLFHATGSNATSDENVRLYAAPGYPSWFNAGPVGGWSGLYLESTSRTGFSVRSGAGDPNVEFHWMACGRRVGYETRPQVTIPDPEAGERERMEKLEAKRDR
jgi:hypothetical protein